MLKTIFALLVAGPMVLSGPLAGASDEPALTVEGGGGTVAMDLATIKEMGGQTIATTTDWDWHKGVQKFSGVPALELFKAAGVTGETVRVIAADEYEVTMTLDDLKRHGAIVATELNGEALTDESFGPLWLVFPYDAMSAEEREAYTARSVWSIVRIEVE